MRRSRFVLERSRSFDRSTRCWPRCPTLVIARLSYFIRSVDVEFKLRWCVPLLEITSFRLILMLVDALGIAKAVQDTAEAIAEVSELYEDCVRPSHDDLTSRSFPFVLGEK